MYLTRRTFLRHCVACAGAIDLTLNGVQQVVNVRASSVTVPANARILRNLVNAANLIESHILHFYLLALPDFIAGPAMPPWQADWSVDRRFDQKTSEALMGGYLKAIEMRRKGHEMGALFGGRLPHPPAYIAGGFTANPRPERIAGYRIYLNELIGFIRDRYIPDAELLASQYDDYLRVGRGYGNLLAFGVFELNDTGDDRLLAGGHISAGSAAPLPVDAASIAEHVTHSWFKNMTDGPRRDRPRGGRHCTVRCAGAVRECRCGRGDRCGGGRRPARVDHSNDAGWMSADCRLARPVDTSRALFFHGQTCNGTGDLYPRPFSTAEFTSDDTLRIERQFPGQQSHIEWHVVELPAATFFAQEPHIELVPDSLAFPPTAAGSHADLAFDIRNAGTADLLVHSLEFVGLNKTGYSLVSPFAVPFTIAPQTGGTITVRFAPTSPQSYDYAKLAVGSNDPNSPVVELALTGVAAGHGGSE